MITRAGFQRRTVVKVREGRRQQTKDAVVVEEPLEIRLSTQGDTHSMPLATVMRTPGADVELAAGFLFSEGIIHERSDIATIRYCLDTDHDEEARFNTLIVTLRPTLDINLDHIRRLFFVSSSCGVCGKISLESLRLRGCMPLDNHSQPQVSCTVLTRLDQKVQQAQALFTRTGGLHAAALFSPDGQLYSLHEDIGRHNAVDKLIGEYLLNGRRDLLAQSMLMVSGRASFEIMQKALMGLLRGASFNIYAGAERVA